METRHTFCRICEALCGLEMDVAEGRVAAVRPDPQHVATSGYACIKGLRQHEIYGSPDRLTHPLAHGSRVSWERAVGDVGAKVRSIVAQHGADAIAMYVGTAAGFGVLHPIFASGFMQGLGSRSMYSSATQDCSNKFAVARLMYGFPFLQPFPDVDRTRCLIVVGANPAVSKWSFLHVPNPIARLKAITARGGKLYFVDPRRTESAKVAGEHVFIRPGTDVFFYLAFLHEVMAHTRSERGMRGLDAVRAVVAPWTPERAEEVTGIAPASMRRMVDDYLSADGAALYSSTGVNMGPHGALAFWLQEVTNAVSGNLDRLGGTLVGRGIFDFPGFAKSRGLLVRSDRSRIGGFSAVNDAFPGGVLADEILTPGRGQVRALFVTGGNPLLTMANAGRLREALSQLELLVVLDILPSETAALAHYVLPCTSPIERPDLPFLFPLLLGMQSRPYLQATEAVVDAPGEARDEATIYLELARASGVSLFGSTMAQRALELARTVFGRVPQRALLSLLLRLAGEGSFRTLARATHGRLRPPHRGNDFLGKRVLTDDGLVDLAPPSVLEAARGLENAFERERRERRRLRLITRRAVATHNSWTHNHPRLHGDGTNYLYMHPDDARRAGIGEGELADVRSDTACVRVPVRFHADLMPGTVALPHGWGHQAARGLSVASRTRGVNVNLLAADGPKRLERVSGMAQLTAIAVDVTPAAGAQDSGDWSGIAPDGASTG